jgi:hypothetical protein
MKKILIVFLAMLSVSPAYADGGRGGGYGHERGHGGGWGGAWIFPALIGGAIVYDLSQPRTVVQPQAVYIQPAPVYAPAPAAQQYWYFCAGANAYYPYVAACPGGWQVVPASPPPPPYAPPAR